MLGYRLQQQADALATNFFIGLCDGGRAWKQFSAQGDAVKADHTDIVGNLQANLLCRAQTANGNQIVGANHGCGAFRLAQESGDAGKMHVLRRRCLLLLSLIHERHFQQWHGHQASLVHSFQIATAALLGAIRNVQMTAYHGNAAMALPCQVADQFNHGLLAVDGDARMLGMQVVRQYVGTACLAQPT